MERVVLDPGVLVSALITPHGNPAKLWQAVVDQRLEIAVCPRLLAELAGVLERSKFRSYVTLEEAQAFVAEVARRAQVLAAKLPKAAFGTLRPRVRIPPSRPGQGLFPSVGSAGFGPACASGRP